MSAVSQAVAAFLKALPAPLDDPELQGTPERVAKLWGELLSGYDRSPESVLADQISSPGPAVVTVLGLPFQCVCPHHLTPAYGVVHLAYEPGPSVIGFGALGALVHTLSRRLILQEVLAVQLVDALMVHLKARGAACLIDARHLCLLLRREGPRDGRVITRLASGTLNGRNDLFPQVDP